MSEDEEYTIFIEIMFNLFSADEMAYADAEAREAIEQERKTHGPSHPG